MFCLVASRLSEMVIIMPGIKLTFANNMQKMVG